MSIWFRNILYYVLGFLSGAVILSLFSAMQKAKLGVDITSPQAYVVPFLFGGLSGLVIAAMMLRQRGLFFEKMSLQQRAHEELEQTNVQLLQEIAERRQAQEALANNEQWLLTLINAIPDFIVFLDDKGQRIVANETATHLFNLPDMEFAATSAELSCPMREQILSAFPVDDETFWKMGDPVSTKVSLSSPRGKRHYEVTRVPLFFEDGSRKGCVMLGRDISRSERVQEELTRYAHFNKLLLDSVGEGIYGVDVVGNTTFMNPAAQLLTGFTEDDLLGENQHSLLHHTREDGSAYPDEECPIVHTLASGKTSRVDEDIFWRKDGNSFPVAFICTPIVEHGTIMGAVVVFRDITLRKEAERKLSHQAYHDTLTELPNRAMFMERLEKTMQCGGKECCYAMLFMDLDNFKLINDSYGHQTGDELLVLLARRLESVVSGRGLLARLGGDEFAILMESVGSSVEAVSLAQDIHDAISDHFQLEHYLVEASASMGIVFGTGEHKHPHQLLRDADIAMYQAKARGKGYTEVFNKDMHARIVERMELERELGEALEEQQFQVFYQPVLDLKNGRLSGFEALVRWQHPKWGLLAPGVFINVAEETGMIIPLGEWVLRESCRQLAAWRERYPEAAELTMSVNVSARQFLAVDLASLVRSALLETNLSPSALKIELTESMLLEEVELAAEIMGALIHVGVGTVLDDFGTGYSSLSHLRSFPLEMVKVDRSFVGRMVQSLDDAAIVANLVELAHILDLRVTAEGVEDEKTLRQLVACHCDLAQGFCISKPKPAKELELFLAKGKLSCENVRLSLDP